MDLATGEIFNIDDLVTPPKQNPPSRDLRMLGEIGLSIRPITKTRDAEEAQAYNQAMDSYPNTLRIDHEQILHLLMIGIGKNEVILLNHFTKNLAACNLWFGAIHELPQSLELSLRSIERALSSLQNLGLIKISNCGKTWPTRIDIHPQFGWKGSKYFQKKQMKTWVGPAKFGGKYSSTAQ